MTEPEPLPGQRIGWKVMRTNPEGTKLISGADGRIHLPIQVGEFLEMPYPGVWMSLERDYVLDYYRGHDHEALLCLSFDPSQVCDGNLTDRQTEFAVPCVTLLGIDHLDPEE